MITKKAKLIIDYEMTDGGCNACVPFKAEIAKLIIGDQTIMVGELTPEALIMTIAIKEGFRQEMKYDVLDDYILFTSNQSNIKQTEDFIHLHYHNLNGSNYSIKKFYQEKNDLLAHVNHVLVEVFDLYPIDF
ncbi:DUF4809 family protein [Vagococcus xieshaowenii]|uniref:DUF4809 family protein n=1 Tax=Vagococcus xieshaowenii TaxID=2562451 RepID=A0A4Z0DB26_9ENTE|nr:DUF4809 family protein [Vagococcus xieshaowenii]QCA29318.1 DUF4809 family protein [Vagococcus xieshaowenii]TFZ41987.1 DUF4809 family protein [Vagococcus xieshaowenii]